MKQNLNITICGGGSLGLVCAGVFASQGNKINILTGHPNAWSNVIKVFDQSGRVFDGTLNIITPNASEAIGSSDIVLLCVPGYLIENTLIKIKPYLNSGTLVGSIVSSTGFFVFAHKILSDIVPLFGFQRVPFIARQKEYGHIGELLGYKKSLNVAIENFKDANLLAKMLEELFLTPVNILNNWYEASLTNSNPILHTGRLFSMWKDYDGEVFYKPTLFYSDWTDEASEILLAMDSEFMKLTSKLEISSDTIPSLLEYYESTDAKSLTSKIKSIPAFKNITSPMRRVANGYVPDFSSRYFTEDFPFGLRFIKILAEENDISTPTIDKVLKWGMSKINNIG